MANYTPAEIEGFRRKDKLNARFSSLKAAATNNEGKGKKPASIKKEADEYYTYLMQDQLKDEDVKAEPAKESGKKQETETAPPSNQSEPAADSDTLPKPNLAQKKVLDVIFDRLGAKTQQDKVTIVKSILRWSFAVHDGSKVLPSKMASVDEFLKWNESN